MEFARKDRTPFQCYTMALCLLVPTVYNGTVEGVTVPMDISSQERSG